MATVKINTQYFHYDLDYKEEICGDTKEFNETFVINGNYHFASTEKATWYIKTKEMLSDIDSYMNYEKWYDKYSELTKKQKEEIKTLYDKCYITDQIIVNVLNIIYPDRNYVERTMRGYSQGDWQNVIYDAKIVTEETYKILEAFYMGKIAELYYEEENIVNYVTDDALWNAERNGTLEQLIRDSLDIPTDEPIEIYKSNGIVTKIKWERI